MEQLQSTVEVSALAIHERVARIHDALHGLHDLTLLLFSTTERNPRAVGAWLKESQFGEDPYGYFERLPVLEAARSGAHDPRTHIYYAVSAIADDAEALHRMFALRSMADVLSGLRARLEGLAWMYYQDATRFSLTYPMHDPRTVVPADFDWHTYHTYLSVLPDVNPEREIRWTPPNIDYGGKGLMVAPSIPLYRGDELMGVWSFDVPVASLIEDCMSSSFVEEQDSFIVGADGMLVAHRSLDPLGVAESGEVVRKPLAALGDGYAALDLAELKRSGRATLVDGQGVRRRVVARSIAALGWLLVASVPEEGLIAELSQSFQQAFERLGRGDLAHRMGPIGAELQGMVTAYNDMVGEVQNTLEANERATRDLERSRHKTRAIFDGAPVGLVLLRPDRSIVDVNAEFGRLLGMEPEGLLDRDLASLATEELRPRFAAELDAPTSRAGEAPIETELRRKSGELLPVRVILRGLELDGALHLLAGVEDLTQRRNLQARLQHTQQVQAIGKLAAGVAHDFNNLLTSVVGNAYFLQAAMKGREEKEYADAIMVAARTGSALTSQLLAISRREIVQPRAVSLPKVLRESETLLRRLLDEDVVFEFEIDDSLPSVWADPGQLLQVVMNLVVNARDALSPDGSRIDVRLAKSVRAGSLRLSVTDDGTGIPAPLRERVFEAFYTTKDRGTGLGLSTVRDIVHELGGNIEMESEVGRGTTVHVDLPLLESDLSATPDAEPDSGRVPDRVIVVVDDEPAVRDITVRLLQEAGFEAEGHPDGPSALQALESLGDRAGLLLTDVVMPGMSGRTLADAALERRPDIAVLFMSGYTDDAILRRGVEASNVALLRKPFRPAELLEAVRAMLDVGADA